MEGGHHANITFYNMKQYFVPTDFLLHKQYMIVTP